MRFDIFATSRGEVLCRCQKQKYIVTVEQVYFINNYRNRSDRHPRNNYRKEKWVPVDQYLEQNTNVNE